MFPAPVSQILQLKVGISLVTVLGYLSNFYKELVPGPYCSPVESDLGWDQDIGVF